MKKTTEQTIQYILKGVVVFVLCGLSMYQCAESRNKCKEELARIDLDEQEFISYHRSLGHNIIDY